MVRGFGFWLCLGSRYCSGVVFMFGIVLLCMVRVRVWVRVWEELGLGFMVLVYG